MTYKKSISNIAWEYKDNERVFEILKDNDFDYIEVAPLELVDSWTDINWGKLENFRKLIDQYKLKVCSMQSVFYKTDFILYDNFDECIQHFKKIEKICEIIDCDYVVFGAPRLRNIPKAIPTNFAYIMLHKYFQDLKTGVRIGLEAVPAVYSTNMLNDYDDVDRFVLNSSANLNIHFDMAAALSQGFEAASSIDTSKITNIHLSRLYLEHIRGNEKYIQMIREKKFLNGRFVSIEMKKSSIEDIINSIKVFEEND